MILLSNILVNLSWSSNLFSLAKWLSNSVNWKFRIYSYTLQETSLKLCIYIALIYFWISEALSVLINYCLSNKYCINTFKGIIYYAYIVLTFLSTIFFEIRFTMHLCSRTLHKIHKILKQTIKKKISFTKISFSYKHNHAYLSKIAFQK